MAFLELITAGVSILSGVVNIGNAIQRWATGFATVPDAAMLSDRVQKLEEHVYFHPRQEVQDLSLPAQGTLETLQLIVPSAQSLQRTLVTDVIFSTPITAPERVTQLLQNPDHFLYGIAPLRENPRSCGISSDPTALPVTFEKWNQWFVGYIKIGLATEHLGLRYQSAAGLCVSSDTVLTRSRERDLLEYLEGLESRTEDDISAVTAELDETIAKGGDVVDALIVRGYIHYVRDDHGAALISLSSAIELDRSFSISYYIRAVVLYEAGLAAEALENLSRCFQLSRDPQLIATVEEAVESIRKEFAAAPR